jgi:hypothetical protein
LFDFAFSSALYLPAAQMISELLTDRLEAVRARGWSYRKWFYFLLFVANVLRTVAIVVEMRLARGKFDDFEKTMGFLVRFSPRSEFPMHTY